jgi:hypothetical protein
MKKDEIQMLVKLREYVIESYKNLDGTDSPSTAITKQEDVAYTLESVIRSLDDMLKEYVNFQ